MPDLKQPWSERQVAVTCHILKETSRNSHSLVLFGLSVEIVPKSGHTGLCVSFRWLGQRVRIYKACFVQKSIGQLGAIPFYDFYYKLIFERPHHPNNLQLPMGLVFVQKQIKSLSGCLLYIFHLSGLGVWPIVAQVGC